MNSDKQVEIRYQIFEVSIAAANTEYEIDFETDKTYDRVVNVDVYGDTDYSSNRNCQFTQPFKINNEEVYCVGFDTFLLFPRLENKDYRTVNEEADGSKVYSKVKDPVSAGFLAYTLKVVLTLERDAKH